MASLSKIIDVFISAGIVSGVFLALVLTTNKNRKRRSNRILSALLIILSISIAHSVFWTVESPLKIKHPFILLVGPFLLFYVQEAVKSRQFKPLDALHFVPFLFFFIIFLPVYFLDSSYSEFLSRRSGALSLGVWTATLFQYSYYWWKIHQLIYINECTCELEFSNTEGKTLSWMKSCLFIFGACFLLLTVTLPIAIQTNNYTLVDKIVCLVLSLTVFVLGYEGLFQEEIFSNVALQQPLNTTDQRPQDENKLGSLSFDDNGSLQKLLLYMDEKKPYLDETLSLTDLAARLDMTRNQLSMLINNHAGENFYSFINKYRVQEVKNLISDSRKNNFTILALAYEAGFPSKSSFQSIFKKFTGLTPTEYRARLQ